VLPHECLQTLQGWFIFTTLLLLCTLKSTVAFFSLFFTLDLAFLFLAISFLQDDAEGKPHHGLTIAGGLFGLLAALLAWYNALAGIADTSNRYVDPGLHVRGCPLRLRLQNPTLPRATFDHDPYSFRFRVTKIANASDLVAFSSSPSHTSRGPRRVANREDSPTTKITRHDFIIRGELDGAQIWKKAPMSLVECLLSAICSRYFGHCLA
jgi:GPR1/FUN34/yaaH family